MTTIELQPHPIAPKELLRKAASEEDTEHVYEEPGIYTVQGRPTIIYGRLQGDYSRMLWAVRSLGYFPEVRSAPGGNIRDNAARGKLIGGKSRIFGFRPRVPYNPAANFCSISSTGQEFPAQHKILCDLGELLDALYSKAAPEVAEMHSEHLRGVRSEWILPGTRFTSGIVNQNNPLRYHYDRGNFPGVFSCMVVFRNLCEGGFLSVPEFNCRFALEDQSYFLFDGQALLHGVTPIKKLNRNGYRYSVVYYALKAMAKCGTLEQEISRARAEKRGREQRRV